MVELCRDHKGISLAILPTPIVKLFRVQDFFRVFFCFFFVFFMVLGLGFRV